MNKEIICNVEDLLKPINKKLDNLPTKEDFNNLSMGLCQEIAYAESKVNHIATELNDVQQYLRRYDLCIFNVPVTAIANKEVLDWIFECFTKKLGINNDEKIPIEHIIMRKREEERYRLLSVFAHGSLDAWFSKTEKNGNYPIRVDLTKSNMAFFNDTKHALMQYSTMVKYTFIDIHCKINSMG